MLLCSDSRLDDLRKSYKLEFRDAVNKVCTKPKDWAALMARIVSCDQH